eukprot:NODE_7_length_48057_cov_0.322240.p11 type:complete len:320 gc:universal NODE_7_length_48057_cov_0.322240:17933-18892(+)
MLIQLALIHSVTCTFGHARAESSCKSRSSKWGFFRNSIHKPVFQKQVHQRGPSAEVDPLNGSSKKEVYKILNNYFSGSRISSDASDKEANDIYGYSKGINFSELECFTPKDSKDRSPCPFINSLANCHLINFSGKDIPLQQLKEAAMHIGNVFMGGIDKVVDTFKPVAKDKDGKLVIDLNQLNVHRDADHLHAVEHDYSLTRLNYFEGDNHTPNNNLIEQLMQFATDGYLTLNQLIKARTLRMRQTRADSRHKAFNDWLPSSVELVFLATTLGRDDRISVQDAYSFLKLERFPKNWSPRPKVLGQFEFIRKLAYIYVKE